MAKAKISKAKEKVGKAKAKTEGEKPKVKKQEDTKPIKKSYMQQPLSKLKFNMVKTGYLQTVHIDGTEDLKLSYSWIELCLILLGAIHNCNKQDYLKVLFKNKVLSGNFEVTTAKRELISNESGIKTLEIAGTDFYLITNLDEKSIFRAIAGMALALKIKPEEIKFDILPLDRVLEAVKLTEGTVVMKTTEYSLTEAITVLNDSSRIKLVNILGYEKEIVSFTEAVLEIINWLNEMYGEAKLAKSMKCNSRTIGITDNENVDCLEIIKIVGTKLFLYDNNSDRGCLEYMINLCIDFGISPELIKITLSQLCFNKQ